MITYFNMLNKKEKIRLIIFTLIAIYVAWYTVKFVWDWWQVLDEQLVNTKDMNVVVDGGSLNWVFVPLTIMYNGFLMMGFEVMYVFVLAIIGLVSYGIFRILAFIKTDSTSEAEYMLAKLVLAVVLAISAIISLIIARFNFLCIALFILPDWLFGYLFYVLPLKRRRTY